MGRTKPPCLAPQRRIENVHEVVVGFGKKQTLDEARRCPQCAEPTCLTGCPLGVDIPGFIRLLREDDAAGALERIRAKNPFPAVCGRICPAPCERACVFSEDAGAISIRDLERYAADMGRARAPRLTAPVPTAKRVAVIGSGPCGMSAAYVMAKAGLGVTIFEAMHEPGGLLRYGVPEFRLPQEVLDDVVADLAALGVKCETDVLVGGNLSVVDVFARGHAALLLTVGAGLPRFSGLPGENAGGVYYAQEFLMRSQLITKTKIQAQGIALTRGRSAAVIGCGLGALDAARLARRLGQDVHLIFEGVEEELGVPVDELNAAVEEGIQLLAPAKPLGIECDDHGCVLGVKVQRMEVTEHNDGLGLNAREDTPDIIEVSTVIIANGRRPGGALRRHLPQLKWNADGSLWVDRQTGLTSMEKIFAAGEVATGAGAVVDAIAAGKDAAAKIIDFLSR